MRFFSLHYCNISRRCGRQYPVPFEAQSLSSAHCGFLPLNPDFWPFVVITVSSGYADNRIEKLNLRYRCSQVVLDGQGKSLRITVSLKTRRKLGHLVFEKERPTVSRKNARKIGIPG